MVTRWLQEQIRRPSRPVILGPTREHLGQQLREIFIALIIYARRMTSEPPVGIVGKLSKVQPVTVHMAAHVQNVLQSLAHAMLMRTSNVKTNVAEADGIVSVSAVP